MKRFLVPRAFRYRFCQHLRSFLRRFHSCCFDCSFLFRLSPKTRRGHRSILSVPSESWRRGTGSTKFHPRLLSPCLYPFFWFESYSIVICDPFSLVRDKKKWVVGTSIGCGGKKDDYFIFNFGSSIEKDGGKEKTSTVLGKRGACSYYSLAVFVRSELHVLN